MQDTHVDKEKPDDNTLKRFLLLILLPSIIVLTTANLHKNNLLKYFNQLFL